MIKTIRNWVAGILALVIVGGLISIPFGMIGRNDNQNYQVLQSVSGNMIVRDKAGIYARKFATVTTYPKAVQVYYSADVKEGGASDDSIRATFNDGGTADISTIVRFRMPDGVDNRLMVHREFTANQANVVAAVRAHLVNCVKATATMMTSSENQTSRKAEFAKAIGDQLQDGLFRFRRVERPVLDVSGNPKVDSTGKPETTFATEIVRTVDTGAPTIDAISPLKQYGIEIVQFSVTSVEYDAATRDQFAKKKDASLKAELAKIQVEMEKQQTAQTIEAGKRMKAEKEAEMNVKVAESSGMAEMKVATAVQAKLEATERKEAAEIEANQKLEVAKIERLAANEDAQRMILIAEAEQKQIEIAGKLTEKEQVLAEIAAKRDAMVAAELAKLQLPRQVVMTGGGGSGNGADQLFNVLGVNQTIDLMTKLSAKDGVLASAKDTQ